jgi:hypothetical protein
MIIIELPGIPELGLIHAICTNGAELTVRATVVAADRLVEPSMAVPVMVMVAAPAVAVLLAVRVSTLEPAVGLVPNAAVTPLGMPEAVRVTPPVNPPTSVTVMVSVPPALRAIERADGEAESLKLPVPVTVRETVVVTLRLPEVPVMVTVEVPAAAALLAANVTTLVAVAGLVPNVALTPVGNPDAARVTLPVNPFNSGTEIVLVPVPPGATVRLAGVADSVKLGGGVIGLTVRPTTAVCSSEPLVPVTVMPAVPTVAVLVVETVRVAELPVVDVGLIVAVTPAEAPLTANATAPVNPPVRVMVIALVPLDP